MLVVDSATELGPTARDALVVCGSHGGAYPAAYAARLGVRAIILHDAGVGRDAAGIAGLTILAEAGIAAVTVASSSAVIGDGRDTLKSGSTSYVNAGAEALGCVPGQSAEDAAALLCSATPAIGPSPEIAEARYLIREGDTPIWALDSVSCAAALETDCALLFTGSHCNLLGGRPETALRAQAHLAVFNDAGTAATGGATRLPELDRRGIPAATVTAASARIGDGRSTYHDGILSAVNDAARALGARPGSSAHDLADLVMEQL